MSEYDTMYTREIVCPHCGRQFTDSWEFNMDDGEEIDVECRYCEKEFVVTCDVTVTYSSRIEE